MCRQMSIVRPSELVVGVTLTSPLPSRATAFTYRYLGKNCSSCAGLTRVSTRSRSRKLFDIGVCGAAWIRGSLSASSGRPLAGPVGPRMTNLEPRSEICECRSRWGEGFSVTRSAFTNCGTSARCRQFTRGWEYALALSGGRLRMLGYEIVSRRVVYECGLARDHRPGLA